MPRLDTVLLCIHIVSYWYPMQVIDIYGSVPTQWDCDPCINSSACFPCFTSAFMHSASTRLLHVRARRMVARLKPQQHAPPLMEASQFLRWHISAGSVSPPFISLQHDPDAC